MDVGVEPLCDRLSLGDFLCLDGPWGIPAAPGEDKSTFMSRLGLNERCEHHRAIFLQMQKEARRAREVLCYDPEALLPELRDDTLVGPPYSIHDIREDAFQQAALRVYQTACAETQSIYALVGSEEDNWVVRWMLWHVIEDLAPTRSTPRDSNRATLLEQTFPTPDSCMDDDRQHEFESDGMVTTEIHTPRRGYHFNSIKSMAVHEDGVFEAWDAGEEMPYSSVSRSLSSSRGYWDPIRDV